MAAIRLPVRGRGMFDAVMADIKQLTVDLREQVAVDAAEEFTRRTREDFDAGRTVYGQARPTGAGGERLDLVRSGAVRAQLNWRKIGTLIRVQLGPSYSRYLVGKYNILPNGPIPTEWSKALADITAKVGANRKRVA